MAMIEPTGGSAQLIQPAATAPLQRNQQETVSERPVEEPQPAESSQNPATSEATDSSSRTGRNVDTFA